MNDQFHPGTFIWGAVLTLGGAILAGVGFGWWDISGIDLRYVGPAFFILIGVVILASALTPRRSNRADNNVTR